MTNPWFLAAGALALIGFGAHFFVYGRRIVPALRKADIPPGLKHVSYYCWHVASIVLLAMSGSFLVAAKKPAAIDVAILMTVLAGAFALWSLGLSIWNKRPMASALQWALFILIAALGAAGLHYQSNIAL